MGFKFTNLCDLLSSLEETRILKATTHARNQNPDVRVVTQWFARHDKRIRGPDTDQLALISCIFPEKRTDRVFWLQGTGLARVIGRCLLLGSSRREELEKWRISGGADLGQCVEDVMRQAENYIVSGQEVTIEEIDTALNRIASRCRFSGPKVRKQPSAVDVEETLSPLYRRLSSRDAKWLTRMILKTHISDVIPGNLTLKSYHFLLPHLLLFQDSFEAALNLLSSKPISHFPPRPEPGFAKNLALIALHHLTPDIGIKIGRPEYYKARSIKHCCKMVGQGRMSVERKYDGEYCQIHVDLSKYPNVIQIFSKSGKDSTKDRAGVHQAVKDALRIGKEHCKISRRCILEGELLVWSDKDHSIMQFHKLRKFIPRSGIFIGTENDSPPQPHEHLMMVFFDILLLDDDICLRKPHRERRLLLKDTIQIIPGLADIAEQRVIDLSRLDGESRLQSLFSMGIADRWEGLVLKGCEDPYFPILIDPADSCFGRWIKLKKDYIPGLGDTIDLALIGAAYNSRDASSLGLVKRESWTHFYVGCLENKNDVLQFNAKQRYCIVDVIDRHCMSEMNMHMLNKFGKYSARSVDSGQIEFKYGRSNLPPMDVVFKTAFVVEMLGSGFEKPSGARYYTLRFPRILKIHSDRSLEDAASFRELQLLAEAAVSVPSDDLAEEEMDWAKRVRSSTSRPGYLPDESQSSSVASSSTPSRTSALKGVEPDDFHPSSSRPNPFETSHTAGVVPIYIDRSSSSSSDRSGDFTGKTLADNGNLLSPGNTRKRKVSLISSELCNKDASPGSSQGTRAMSEQNGPSTRNTFSTCLSTISAGKASRDDEQVSNKTKTQSDDIESPFSTIPLYINSEILLDKHTKKLTGLTNIARTINDFLLMLKSEACKSSLEKSNPREISPKPTKGIMFADLTQKSLGTTLLELSQHISQGFQAPTSSHHPKGCIFLINSNFLQLDINLRHTKFCLRKTWEKISREYFYACLAWYPEDPPGHGVPVDEVPGTPMDKRDHALRDVKRNRIPKLRFSFDRKEALVLGEFCSFEPLVLAQGQ
ncbi:hypothetical protein BDW59DRAFT_181114 [Aspergillus cavernicola]|uniref:ATP-dependent DNA ligase family profile domain-containing protein n=1 Tax=Aspergillus cavernicola TaxID=176166 RepID=A0ABR4I249_9EURO